MRNTEETRRRINLVLDTVALYKEKLHDSPTISGLPLSNPETAERIVAALHAAIVRGKPYETDAAWYEAIGVEPPPEDARV